MAATPHVRLDRTVRGEVVARPEPARALPPGAAGDRPATRRRGPGIGGLLRLARRLGGRARRPASAAITAAVPAAVAVAAPVTRAVAPVVGPIVGPIVGPVVRPVLGSVLEPLLRPVTPLAGVLASPLGKVAGDPRRPRPALSLRAEGHDLPAVPEVLARLARDDSGRVVVLVPASGGDELTWRRGIEATGATYGDRLADLLGWSPLTLRHDDGVGPAEGAPALSVLLQRIVEAWPVPVTRLVLVAEGDGGLLARGALGLRRPGPRPWTDLVTELVALGTPQLGAVPAGGRELDLGVGRRLEEELAGLVPVGPEVLDVPPLDHVDYLLVADRAAARPHPLGRALGGLLRWRRGARRVHDLFPTAERFEVATGGPPLVNHPEIHDALLRWLA